MGGLAILRGIVGGVDQAAGNPQGAQDLQDANARDRAAKLQAQQLQVAPLSQSLNADRLRLAAYVDPKTLKPLPGHEDDYDQTLNRMADTIGQIRGHMGDKAPSEDVGGLKAAAARLLDKTHVTRDLQGHLQQGQTDKANQYAAQNRNLAVASGNSAVPPPQQSAPAGPTPYQVFAQNYKEATGNEPPENVKEEFARKQGGLKEDAPVAKPVQAKPLEAGGVLYGIEGSDGKQYPLTAMYRDDTPQDVKDIFKSVKDAQEAKQTEQQRKEQEVQDRFDRNQARLEEHFNRSQQDKGTWTQIEDGQGNTKLLNTKTREIQDLPEGTHKPGYYTKQVVPIVAAQNNINEYIDAGNQDHSNFTGPGDLDLQHQYFTATQPAAGFRMTKVQQDILKDSQSWLDSLQGKAYHVLHGTWFSDTQRKQIADEANKAIEAKKKALNQPTGPKTQKLQNQGAAGPNVIVVSPEDMQ